VRITIPLSEASGDALRVLASREYRDPRQQAKYLLEQTIRERSAGALPAEPTPDHRADQAAVEAAT
jgi:hypothetical protein